MIMGWEALAVAFAVGWAFGWDSGRKSITRQVAALARTVFKGK